MKAEALRLHGLGFWVIPNHWIKEDGSCSCPKGRDCSSPGKHPITSWKEAQTRRFTRGELEIWWATYPDANIGVLTGELPDLVCIDVDVKDGIDGRETALQHAIEGRELPKTLTDARGDGLHLFFRYPKGALEELRNIQDGKLGPGLDLRAGGGQVVIAPSMHYSGERRRIVDDTPPAELPGWVVDLALSHRQKDRGDQATPERIVRDNTDSAGLPVSDRKRLIDGYMRKHYPGRVVSGSRHHALQQIGGLMRAAGSEAQEIYDFLVDVNQTLCDPPKPDADQEIRDIAKYLMDKPATMSASSVEQDFKHFARWKLNKQTGEWDIVGIDRQKAIAHFREKYHPVSYRGDIWLYQDGTYSPEKGRINQDLTEISIGLDIQAQRSTYLEIILMLKGVNLHHDDPFNRQEGIIPTLSGVIKLDFQNGTISGPFEHSHEYLFTYKLPVVYDPSSDTQKLMDVFSTWVDADDIKYLIQLPALALIQSWGYDFKQAYLFEGPKNAGKTTYFNLIDGVIGEENRTTITLQNLVFNRFAAAGLVGKLMNVVDELPSVTLSNLDSFKNMIGGHAVWIEKKMQDGYSAHLRAVHCFNCNKPPACKISDDDAWWDRWVYVRFPNVFPSDPKWKTEFLTDETKSAFFNLILDKILVIMCEGGKAARMDPEDVKQIWMASADILMQFLDEETVRDPEGEIPKEDLYSKLVRYCRDRGKTAPTKTAVTIMLGRGGVECSRPKKGEDRVRAYRGIIWKGPEEQVGKNPDNPDTQTSDDPSCPGCPTFLQPLRIIQEYSSTTPKRTKELEKTRTTRTHTDSREVRKNPDNPDTGSPKKFLPVRITRDLDLFVGSDGRSYDCRHDEIVTLPVQDARALVEQDAAVLLSPVNTRPAVDVSRLLEQYALPHDTDLSGHMRFTIAGSVCTCNGCGEPATWHSPDRDCPLPLCDAHYRELKWAFDLIN